MDYTCKETIVNNMKDFGCDEQTIQNFMRCFEISDMKGQKRILEDYRKKLLMELHQSQRNIDLFDYMVHQLEKCNGGETDER